LEFYNKIEKTVFQTHHKYFNLWEENRQGLLFASFSFFVFSPYVIGENNVLLLEKRQVKERMRNKTNLHETFLVVPSNTFDWNFMAFS
jgi:hypothetical protein